MGGRNQSEWVDGFARNCRPESRGIRKFSDSVDCRYIFQVLNP
ncbi:hypothetical protein D1AOALGA4SA_895 [Olavius algarvensis Delta 1 endosymbiont]|nr:hypothetical protein D1AOALGA4SA_895 [Olavius algarvensis Delta 1 endosymbiont]